ncbi:MAG TPA: hypothetical protein VE225_07835, partial [Rubrobacteraceae bacterium]|nr:hypothetical protein [Rubrobacteraceae bacterium]
ISFTVALPQPPVLCISVGPGIVMRPSKDTSCNIEEAGVNIECFVDRIIPLGTDHWFWAVWAASASGTSSTRMAA